MRQRGRALSVLSLTTSLLSFTFLLASVRVFLCARARMARLGLPVGSSIHNILKSLQSMGKVYYCGFRYAGHFQSEKTISFQTYVDVERSSVTDAPSVPRHLCLFPLNLSYHLLLLIIESNYSWK